MRLFATVAVVAALGCRSKGEQPPAEAPPMTEPAPIAPAEIGTFDVDDLAFSWPAPGRVQVEEETTRRGKLATSHYTLDIQSLGESLHITCEDLDFLALPTIDLDDKAYKQRLAQTKALASAIPTLAVSKAGEFVDFIDFDRSQDKVLEILLASTPAVQHDQLRKIMASEAFRIGAKQKELDRWSAWVEIWMTPDLPKAGETADFEDDDGTVVVFTNRGQQPDGTLRLELRRTRELDPGQVGPVLAELGLGPEAGYSKIEMVYFAWVETTRTMRPRHAYLESSIEAVLANGQTQTRTDSHHYTFTW